jgi:hypothetical protein
MPAGTTPHMPGTSASVVPFMHVAGRRAHDRHELARLDACRRGRRDVRVDVADGDRDALRQAGPGGGLGGQRAGPAAERRASGGRACRHEAGEAGLSAARYSADGYAPSW